MTKSKYYQEERKEQECFLPSPFTRQPLSLLCIYFILAFLSGNCLVASNSLQLLTFQLGYLAWVPISDAELCCHIAIAVGMSINFLGFLLVCFLVQKVPMNMLACSGFVIHSIAWLILASYRTYIALVISFSCIGLGNAFVYIALQSIAPSFSCEKIELEILAFLSVPDAIGILLPKLFLSFIHLYPSHHGLVLLSWSYLLLSVAILSLFLFPYTMPVPRERPLFLSLEKGNVTYLKLGHSHPTVLQSRFNKKNAQFLSSGSTALVHHRKQCHSLTQSDICGAFKTRQQHTSLHEKKMTNMRFETTFRESFDLSQSEKENFSGCIDDNKRSLTLQEDSLLNSLPRNKDSLYSLYTCTLKHLPVSLCCTLLESVFHEFFLYKHEKELLCCPPPSKPLVETPCGDSSDTINFNTLFQQPTKSLKKNLQKEQTTCQKTLNLKNDRTGSKSDSLTCFKHGTCSKHRTCPKRRACSNDLFVSSSTRHLCVDIVLEKPEDVQSIMRLEMAALNKENAISAQLTADLQFHTTSVLTMFHFSMIFLVLGWIHFVDIEFLITLRSKLETVSPNHRVTDFYMNLFEFTLASVPQTAFCVVFAGWYSHIYMHWKDIIGCLGIVHFLVLFSLAICLVQITCVWLVCFFCILVFHCLSRGLAFLIFFFLYGKTFSSNLNKSFFVCQAMSCFLWIAWHIFCSSLPITPQTTRTYTLMSLTLVAFFPLTLLYMLEPPLQKHIPELITLKQFRRATETTHARADSQFQNPTVNPTNLSSTRPSISIIFLLLRVLPSTIPIKRRFFRCYDVPFYSDYYGRAWTP